MVHSSGAIRTACDIQIDGGGVGAGRPKLTCKKLTEKNCRLQLTLKKGKPGDQV